jgi:hypothetical protein
MSIVNLIMMDSFSHTLVIFLDENIQVSIKGDLNQAKVEFYANQQKKKSGNGGLEDQNEDIGNDADEDEEKGREEWKVHSIQKGFVKSSNFNHSTYIFFWRSY